MLKDAAEKFVKNTKANPQSMDILYEELLGRGIFGTDGPEWKYQRKVTSQIFSTHALRGQMVDSFARSAEKLVEVLRATAVAGRPVDLTQLMKSVTFDAICDVAVGASPGLLDPKVGEAFDELQRVCTERCMKPPLQWQLERWLQLGDEKAVPAHRQTVLDFLTPILATRRREAGDRSSATGAAKKDLVSLFLEKADGRPELCSDEYLMDMVLNMTVAGRDSTAHVLLSLFRLLAQHPEAEARVAAELGRLPASFEGMKAAQFTEACFQEALRLWSPVGADMRLATDHCTLPSGHEVRRGDAVVVPLFALGRSPKLFADPDEFRPERWLDAEGKVDTKVESSFPVFWLGPRQCLGRDMVRLEAKLLLQACLTQLRVRPRPVDEVFANTPVSFFKDSIWADVELQ